MHSGHSNLFPQPALAVLLSVVALIALAGAWLGPAGATYSLSLADALLSVLLVAGVLFAYLFPIEFGSGMKVVMSTVPLYLAACLLGSVPLAATVGAAAVLAAELILRSRRGNLYADVATASARSTIFVLGAATVAHLDGLEPTGRVLGAAVTMWLLDTLTVPLVVGPMTGEPPLTVFRSLPIDALLAEAAQYLLGLLGALAANVLVWAALLLVPPTALVYLAFQRAKALQAGAQFMLERMADAVDMRDPYTGGHSRRVADLCARMLPELEIFGVQADLIVSLARIHDIGKIGIPDAILRKEEQLTAEEWELMRTHAAQGAELVARYPDFALGAAVIRHHHENWDGSGYPHGLSGTAIPFGARVIAVADSFDAMTSDRPYHPGLPAERAAALLFEGRGKQWDPAVVDACLRAIVATPQRTAPPVLQLLPNLEGDRLA